MAKLHPHIKSFIHSVVLAEMASLGPSKDYQYKETMMKKVQEAVLDSLDNIRTKEDMDRVISARVQDLRVELSKTLDMIESVLKQIPLEVIKQAERK